MYRIKLTILFMFFCALSFAQTIDIVNFNSSTDYCPGSGVSVHINPTGVFNLENAGNLQDIVLVSLRYSFPSIETVFHS